MNIDLADLSTGFRLTAFSPSKSGNYYGKVLINEEEPFIKTGEYEVGTKYDVRKWNFIHSIKIRPRKEDAIRGLEAIDGFMEDQLASIREELGMPDLTYSPLLHRYQNKNGEEVLSLEMWLDMNEKRDTGKFVLKTVCFDENDDQIKVPDFDSLLKVLGDRSTVNLKFQFDYVILANKNRIQLTPKVKFMKITPPSSTGGNTSGSDRGATPFLVEADAVSSMGFSLGAAKEIGTILFGEVRTDDGDKCPVVKTSEIPFDGVYDIRTAENSPVTIRFKPTGDDLAAIKAIDDAVSGLVQGIGQTYGLDQEPEFLPILKTFTNRNGDQMTQAEMRLDCSNRNGDFSFRTKFFDAAGGGMTVLSPATVADLQVLCGKNAKASVQFRVDYVINPDKNRLTLNPKILEMVITRDMENPATPGPAMLTLKVADLVASDDFPSRVTLEEPTDEGMTSRQHFARVFVDGKPPVIELEDITLTKDSNDQSLGLPHPDYEDDKITVPARGANLAFIRRMDTLLEGKNAELKKMFGAKKKITYVPSVKGDETFSSIKFTMDLSKPDKKTRFYDTDNKPIEYQSNQDLEEYFSLNSTIKKAKLVISKVWFDKKNNQFSMKLKLKAAQLEPLGKGEDYIKAGAFKDEKTPSKVVSDSAEDSVSGGGGGFSVEMA